MKALGNKTFCTYIFGLLFHTDEHSGYIWTIQTQKFLVKFRLTWILKLAPLSHHSIHLPHLNILLLLLSLLSLSPAATQTSQSPPIPPIQHPQGQLHCANNHSKHCAQKRRNLIEVFKNKWPKGFLFLLLTHTHLCTHRQNENNSKPHIHVEIWLKLPETCFLFDLERASEKLLNMSRVIRFLRQVWIGSIEFWKFLRKWVMSCREGGREGGIATLYIFFPAPCNWTWLWCRCLSVCLSACMCVSIKKSTIFLAFPRFSSLFFTNVD